MITLRRADERHLHRRHRQELWHTFNPHDPAKPHAGGFGALESLTENRLPPGGVSVARPSREAEIVTYIWKGAIAQEDSTGSSGVVHAGEFQRMAIGHGIRHKERNASRTGWAHIFRISLRPSEVGFNGACEQMRVAAAQRHNVLCVVTSPDGRQGSLHIHQDALIYSSLTRPRTSPRPRVVAGTKRLAPCHLRRGAPHDIILTQGDGVGVTNERSVSLTAHEECEILLSTSANRSMVRRARPTERSRRNSDEVRRSARVLDDVIFRGCSALFDCPDHIAIIKVPVFGHIADKIFVFEKIHQDLSVLLRFGRNIRMQGITLPVEINFESVVGSKVHDTVVFWIIDQGIHCPAGGVHGIFSRSSEFQGDSLNLIGALLWILFSSDFEIPVPQELLVVKRPPYRTDDKSLIHIT